jgi:outer membrane protein assembly factor BamE (lipoprotein component of BamABCDE complex)
MRLVIILVVSLALVGCSRKDVTYHGYTFNDIKNIDSKVSEFTKQKSNIDEVRSVLGSPSFIETVQNNQGQNKYEFFYVQNIFTKEPFIGKKKSHMKVLRVSFDYDGRVYNTSFYDIVNKDIFDKSLKTQIKTNKMQFFEQMIKNITNTK